MQTYPNMSEAHPMQLRYKQRRIQEVDNIQ
jgi:hypothetical protein